MRYKRSTFALHHTRQPHASAPAAERGTYERNSASKAQKRMRITEKNVTIAKRRVRKTVAAAFKRLPQRSWPAARGGWVGGRHRPAEAIWGLG